MRHNFLSFVFEKYFYGKQDHRVKEFLIIFRPFIIFAKISHICIV